MNRQIKMGAIIGYVNMIVSAIVSMIYIPTLTKGIGNSEYGIYQLMGSLISYFTTAYTSLNASVLKNYTESLQSSTEERENTLAISRKIFRIISLVICIIAVPVLLLFRTVYRNSLTIHELKESGLVFIVMILNILVFLNNNVYSAAVQAHERFVFRKSIDLISQCFQPFAVILLIKKYPYALTIVIVQLCLNCVVSLSNYIYAKKTLGISIRFYRANHLLVKNIVSMTIAVLGVAFADQIFWKVDQLILGKFYGTTTITQYSISSQINAMYINVGTIIGGMILPSIVGILKKNDPEKLDESFIKYGRYQSYILSVVLTGIILFSDELLGILYSDFTLDMYAVLLLLAVPYTIDLVQNSGNAILQAKNLYGFRAKVLLSAAIINIGMTITLSAKYGMCGAALATAVTITITSGILMNIVYKVKANLNIGHFWKEVVPIWIKTIPMLLLGAAVKKIAFNNAYATFFIHILLYLILYIILFLTFIISKKDSGFMQRLKGDKT